MNEKTGFEAACHASGITRKGRRLARKIWRAAEDVYRDEIPHTARDIAGMAAWLFRCYADDIEYRERIASLKGARRKSSSKK